jgi:hypothetical protein
MTRSSGMLLWRTRTMVGAAWHEDLDGWLEQGACGRACYVGQRRNMIDAIPAYCHPEIASLDDRLLNGQY